MRETEPSIVCYGARVWESQAAMVQARILGADAIKRSAFRLLMPLGYKMADLKYRKQKPSLFPRILYPLADLALFKPIRKSLGLSNARICYTTGAMLSPDAFRFYHALNLPLKSLYGTTEGGALTGAKNDDIHLDTVGPAHPGTEVKITDAGEIIYRQPGVFVGYYQDPDKTAQVLKEGWFYTGDRGFVREDGQIVFLDRLEDFVELASGDELAPQFIESRLKSSPYIKDAWVLAGPERAFASAIIIINYDNVSRWAGQRRVTYTTFTDLSQKSEVYGLVKTEIDRINKDLPPSTRVKKYANLHKEFDPNEGELTRTRKLRKRLLEKRYQELILAIYEGKSELPIGARGTHGDERTGTIATTINIYTVEEATL